MTMKRTILIPTVAAALMLSGCAAGASPSAPSAPAAPPSSTPSSSTPSSSTPSSSTPSSPTPSSPAPTASGTAAALPTLTRPAAPPKNPSDQVNTGGWLDGTVTAGGTGPCYGMITDDGKQYALHAADGTELTKGKRIRIKTRPALIRIYCGPGELVEMTAMEPVG
ncbi:hypothetical protein ACWKSP_25140 [Micromonosporaceae bacterium Da 78-11]